jgi:hypothetical protein
MLRQLFETASRKIAALLNKDTSVEAAQEAPEEPVCCSNQVHIAFRGVSDDRMYLSYNRNWQEVKFYRPNGLRVFCATCRRRVL